MDGQAAVETVEGVESSVAVLAVFVREAAGAGSGSGADPLRDQADAWLDALAEAARLEARVAALKVQAAVGFASAEAAMASPDASRRERDVLEMSVTAEVAGALTVSEGSAARFLEESARLNTDLPLTQLRVDAAASWLLGPAPGVDGATGDPAAEFFPTDSLPSGSLPPDSVRAGDVPDRGAPAGDVLAGVPSPAAQVLVTVPVLSLLGVTEEPATLDGYGPIPPSMARRLVADGGTSFLRVLTDPRDGAPLEIGRTRYRLTKPMRQWLRLRDARCTFPSCNNHSLDNDADHILAWADGGGTGIANLGQTCAKHHRLKHATAWQPVGATRESPPGWISPNGRSYPAEYQDWEPPDWPKDFDPPRARDPIALPLDPWPDWPEGVPLRAA